MAHFYGSIQGARGEATRLGTKGSGLNVMAASWSGRITVELFEREGADHYIVRMDQHGASRGWRGDIASGKLGEKPVPDEQPILPAPTNAALIGAALNGCVIHPRRPYDDELPQGLMESDKDYLLNNYAAAVALLDAALAWGKA